MNAKKIMGAVLVALLAVTAFAGVAAADETGLGTVFLYQADAPSAGTFTLGDSTVTVSASGAVSTNDITKFIDGGKYSNGTAYYIVKLPNAAIAATSGNVDVMANGLISGEDVTFEATSDVTGFQIAGFILYNPNGEPTQYLSAGTSLSLTGDDALTAKGEYKIQAVFSNSNSKFVNTVPGNALYGKLYSFTVYSTEPTITASADSVIMGNFITVTVTGIPNEAYTLTAPGFEIYSANQLSTAVVPTTDGGNEATVTLPNTGKAVVYLKAGYDDGKKTLKFDTAKTDVKIEKGAITATAEKDSFFLGNKIVISGTTTAGNTLYYWIEGTNFKLTQLTPADEDVENGQWSAEFNSGVVNETGNAQKKLVAGTYTIIVTTSTATDKDDIMKGTYATVAVTLTQPFLTDIEAAAVAVQGTDYEITGTAIAAEKVTLYIFGTSYFDAQTVTTDDDDAFEFTLPIPEKGMAPGTYFYLIQHPMNDKVFNVWNETDGDFFYAATLGTENGDYAQGGQTFIFNAWTRGTNYAAQALLEEIAGQNIDDIFVQGTFEVEAQKLTINPIPAEVTKGSKLSVSGTTNSGEGVEVIVNVLAGTFGATVKGDENAATFLTEKAVTNDDGTWEAAIDTSKLPVGNYIVTVELEGEMFDSAAVSIVDKAPETPVDPVDPVDPKPVDPVTPTEPETPGFGALAALAGLGAVAVLLLRRE